MAMIAQAVAAGQPLDVIRELKNMAKELAADEAQRAFEEAVSSAKADLKPIVRKSQGHNGKYADLATIADEIDPIISSHGLAYRHKLAQDERGLTVTCVLSHKLGHREETSLTAGPDTSGNKNSIQALGSTQQYLMRYTLLASLGLSTAKDDDGKGATSSSLSEEQIEELQGLIDQAVDAQPGASRAEWLQSFLDYMKAETLNAIPAKDFAKGKVAITNLIRQAGK
ncbi:MAG: ERF family protein [Devosia nanyangense]|nr:ERF family protein [Devosia nanyangense]